MKAQRNIRNVYIIFISKDKRFQFWYTSESICLDLNVQFGLANCFKLWKWWMNELGDLRSFQQYFSHIGTMEGWTWNALCNEAPFRLGKNLASRFEPSTPWSEVGSANRSATRTLHYEKNNNKKTWTDNQWHKQNIFKLNIFGYI